MVGKSNRIILTSILAIFLFANLACASNLPRVQQDLEIYDKQIANFKRDFALVPENSDSIDWVKGKLDHMYEMDQFMRNFWNIPIQNKYSIEEKNEFNKQFILRNNELDLKNTRDIKALINKYEWFKISVFGKDADNKAWLIVQHADQDIQFQKNVLTTLEKLYPVLETAPKNYAYLFDRISSSPNDVSKRMPQRFGTQGQCVGNGIWKPWPIEDEKFVDDRRKAVGLGSMKEYIAMFKDLCP